MILFLNNSKRKIPSSLPNVPNIKNNCSEIISLPKYNILFAHAIFKKCFYHPEFENIARNSVLTQSTKSDDMIALCLIIGRSFDFKRFFFNFFISSLKDFEPVVAHSNKPRKVCF